MKYDKKGMIGINCVLIVYILILVFYFWRRFFSVKNSIINLVTRLSSSYKWTKMMYNSFTHGISRLLKY
jgi:uncharacterized membrane protein YvbJ